MEHGTLGRENRRGCWLCSSGVGGEVSRKLRIRIITLEGHDSTGRIFVLVIMKEADASDNSHCLHS